MSDAPNPYAVTTLEIGGPVVDRGGGWGSLRWLVLVALPLLVIGSAAAIMDIETIMGSGPIMLAYGLILLFLTRRRAQSRFRWFAWTCCVFPILVFLIIFTLQWSPSDAQVPISALCCVFTFGAFCGIFATFARSTDPTAQELLDDVVLKADAGESGVRAGGVSSTTSPSKAP